jgi:DNA-directed RNA polymerase specialized sigma24 family protein
MDTTIPLDEPWAPEPEMLTAAFAKARPEIEALFRRHWVTPEEAEELLDEILTLLLVRWDRIIDPTTWLVRTVDQAIRTRLLIPLFRENDPIEPM